MAEQWPTGTFGHARPRRPAKPPGEPWTAEEQAQHLADLNAALDDWHDTSAPAQADRYRHRPHLHLVPTPVSHSPAA
jgi:hypothetical protein